MNLARMADQADLFDRIASFPALLAASARAARGKRNRRDVAEFLAGQERHLLRLSNTLQAGTWQPGGYRSLHIREPKSRYISVATFADRVVHQALAAAVQPLFERSYIADTYASLRGRGQHACVRRFEHFRDRHPWVLRLDMYRYFPSLDHAILKQDIRRHIRCPRTLALLDAIIDGSNPQEPVLRYYPGDDLFSPALRARGLPLGNLTSQMLGNLYLSGLDHHCKEVLRLQGYMRYLDDVALFGPSQQALLGACRAWGVEAKFGPSEDSFCQVCRPIAVAMGQKAGEKCTAAAKLQPTLAKSDRLLDMLPALQGYLDGRRLLLHPRKTQVQGCANGLHFLGYELLPGGYRRLPQANLSRAAQRLADCRAGYAAGTLDGHQARQQINGWVAHARQADTYRLRAKWFPTGWFNPVGEPPRPRKSQGVRDGRPQAGRPAT